MTGHFSTENLAVPATAAAEHDEPTAKNLNHKTIVVAAAGCGVRVTHKAFYFICLSICALCEIHKNLKKVKKPKRYNKAATLVRLCNLSKRNQYNRETTDYECLSYYRTLIMFLSRTTPVRRR